MSNREYTYKHELMTSAELHVQYLYVKLFLIRGWFWFTFRYFI